MPYSESFREKMVAKMTGPRARSASSLAREFGVAQATLSRWLKRAKVGGMSKEEVGARKRWTSAEKLRVVEESAGLSDGELGEFLRREGLHTADLARFREEVHEAAVRGFEAGRQRRGLSPEERENRALKKELARKEKALAEAAALLVLRGKVQAFFAEGGEGDIDEKTES